MGSPPLDYNLIFCREALEGCLNFVHQQITSVSSSKKATLSFEYAVVEVPADHSLETDIEDFTSDSDAPPDVNENYRLYLFFAMAEDLHSCNSDYSVSVFLTVIRRCRL